MPHTDLSTLPHRFDAEAGACLAVVECSCGERNKFAYEPELDGFMLKRLLPAGMSFPLDFGFIPSTRAEDGDPLDVMILHDVPLAMGALVPVRLVGAVEAEQTEKGKTVRNDRLIAVASTSQQFADVRRIGDLSADLIESVTDFWEHYERLRGAGFKVLQVSDASTAGALLKRASLGSEL